MLKHNKCICCLCTFINIALSVILLFFFCGSNWQVLFPFIIYYLYTTCKNKAMRGSYWKKKKHKKTRRLELITQKIFYKKCRPFLYYFFWFWIDWRHWNWQKKTSNVLRICIYKINDRLQHWPKERRRLRRRSRSRKRKEERIEDNKKML